MKLQNRYSAGLLIICAISAVWCQTSYTLETILAQCQGKSHELALIQKRYEAGFAEVDNYRAEALPFLSFSSGASYVSQSLESQGMQSNALTQVLSRIDGYAFNWSLNLQQPLFTFGKVTSALRIARTRKSNLEDMRHLETDLFYIEVMQQFSQAYSAQHAEEIAKKSSERSERLLQKTKVEYEGGRVSRGDYLRIEALAQGDKAQLISARSTKKATMARLAVLTGIENLTEMRLEIDTQGKMSQTSGENSSGNLQIGLKQAQIDMLSDQQTIIRAGKFPSLYLVGSISNQFMSIDTAGQTAKALPILMLQDPSFDPANGLPFNNPTPKEYFNPDFFSYSIGVQLSWNLFDGRRTSAQLRQVIKQTESAKLELDKQKRDLEITLQEVRSQISALDESTVAVNLQTEAAQNALSLLENDYENGMTDITTLLEADKEYRSAVQQLDNLKIQKMLAIAQLHIAMGLPVYGE